MVHRSFDKSFDCYCYRASSDLTNAYCIDTIIIAVFWIRRFISIERS